MPPFLSCSDRSILRFDAALSPPALSTPARVLLWVDRGCPVARVARAFGISRPTVYRYLCLWREFRDVALLDPRAARRVRPWRRST